MLRGLAGDAGAQRKLLLELAVLLRAYFRRRLGPESPDLEDLVQEALIAIHVRRATYDKTQPFTGWAFTIGRYKLIDYLRRRGRRADVAFDDLHAEVAVDERDATHARLDIDGMLEDLPRAQRRVIRQVKITGLSVAEAAVASSMSKSAVKVSVHRGLRALAARVRGSAN